MQINRFLLHIVKCKAAFTLQLSTVTLSSYMLQRFTVSTKYGDLLNKLEFCLLDSEKRLMNMCGNGNILYGLKKLCWGWVKLAVKQWYGLTKMCIIKFRFNKQHLRILFSEKHQKRLMFNNYCLCLHCIK